MRVLVQEALQLGGQELGDGRDVGHHAHMAAQAAAVLAHLLADAVQVVEHATRHVQQCIGGGRGHAAAVAAREQLHLQLALQLGQPPAGGRGGDVFACGGAGDGAFLHHGHEQAQRNRVEFHGVAIISRPRPAGFCHAGLRWQRRA